MNPSRIFIDRPVATSLLMIAILLVGIVAFRFLPLSALPEVDYPTIQVQTFYPGASPEVMTSAVTAPLERQFGQMASLSQMMSQSSAGSSVITLRFGLDIGLDIAEQEVQAAINAAGNLLPADLPAPPIYAKVNPADAPILTLGVASDSMKLTEVEDIIETRLVPKLSELPGVGLVSISGGQRPAVRIHVNPLALSSVGVNLDDLRTTIANLNVNTPKGNFDGPAQSSAINANDQIRDPNDYAKSVIAYRNGAPVLLSDVATVEIAPENSRLSAWMNTTPALIVNIQRQPGANVIQVVNGIKALLPSLSASLPAAITVKPLTDRTVTIRASVQDVEFELALAVGLVVMVIFLFLRNIPATIIPSLSVPLSLIGALAIMYQFGFSLDNLSLMALTIATGFVVDDAIVVIENIARFLEDGDSPYDAAMKGSAQIGFTIISLTVSLIAVLIPLLFMGDVVGRLFHEFAITLAATIIISAIVSLTLVPMLCAKLLRPRGGGGEASGGRFFQALTRFYASTLRVVLDHQGVMLLVALGTFLLTGYLYVTIPKGFFPIQDTGVIQGVTQAAEAISFDQMAAHQQALAKVILSDPDVESLSSFIGVDGSNITLNSGRILINLKPHAERKATASEIIRRLQQETASVSGISLFMQPVQDLSIDTAVSATQYQFTLENQDLATLQTWTPKVLQRLGEIKSIVDVASDLQPNGRSVMVDVDRANAARFGITPAIVDNTLYDAYGQRIISTIFTQSNQYRVIMDIDPKMTRSMKSLNSLYLPSSASTTGQTPLEAVANFTVKTAPLQISHLKQFPVTTISFNLAPGASLGQAVDAIGDALAEIGLPQSFAVSFQGAAQAFQSALSNEVFLLAAAIAAMYIVLGVLYESFIHPITILTTLPSAGIGALLTLNAAGVGLDIIGVIGIVLLIGIVKKNAIMMIDFALEAQRHQGLPPREAIFQACLLRLRPILMTTVAAIFGALPLMLGTGVGSELRRPLGLVIVGGLVFSQVLTLYTTPVIYLFFEWLGERFGMGAAEFRVRHGSAVNNRFSEIFIKRPVATILLTIGIVFAGLLGYSQLPVSPLPQVDFPIVSVQANMPGASPDTMATSVAAPLERHLGQIADVNEMTSQSSLGSTRITLQFGLDRNIDGAARDVQAGIVAARVDLPTSLRQNPTYHKVNPADAPIMVIAMTSSTHTAGQLYDLASNILQQRLSQLPGIGEVDVSGATLPAVRVEVNPGAVFHYGIGLEDIRAALASANANSPKGAIEDDDNHFQIYANDQASHADQYRDLVIAYRNGAPVRLADVAEVVNSVENLRGAGLVSGKPGVAVILSRQPGANIIEAIDGVRAELPRLIASLPGDVDLTVAVDRSKTIRQSLKDTEKTLVIAVALVILVVFAFLRSVRAAAIPSVAVPTSIIGSLGVMYLLGFSLNNLSLMALTISTGFVVDDAIVVLENVSRYLEQGMPRVQAAIQGAGEVGFTVVSISLSLIAVFAPLLFFGGIVGRLFTEFALTLSVAVMISMAVSLTTTPMMCALILPRGPQAEHGRFYRASERVFDAMLAFYRSTLRIALRHPGTVAMSLLATVGLNYYMFRYHINYGLFPVQDTGLIVGSIQADQSISFQEMKTKLTQLQTIVQEDPAVASVVGFTGGAQTNSGFVYMSLKPYAERKVTADDVVTRLRAKLGEVAGARLYMVAVSDLRTGGRQTNATYQYTLLSDDTATLYEWAPKLTAALMSSDVVKDVNSDQQQGGLQTNVTIDRDTAMRLGLTLSAIDNTLYDAFGQRQVSTIYNPLNQYHVVMEVAPRYWQDPHTLDELYVSTSGANPTGVQQTGLAAGDYASSTGAQSTAATIAADSARNLATNALAASGHSVASSGAAVSSSLETMVPLSAFARFSPGHTPLSVNHQGQFAASTISFNLASGRSLSEAKTEIDNAVQRIGMPSTVRGAFAGTAATYQQSQSSMPLLFGAALVTIYIVLGVLYESLIHPITILSTLFSASVGAALALWLFDTQFTVIAAIGVLLLIGIGKKNAIMMVDFALQAERSGLDTREAIEQACLMRFRPIMMTTFAALFGALPLAFGTGEGSELRHPLGITIVGGLIVSQALTLYTTPVVFIYLDELGNRLARMWSRYYLRAGAVPITGSR